MTSYEREGKIATMSADGDVKFWRMDNGRLFAKEEYSNGKARAVMYTGRDVYERLTMVTTGAVTTTITVVTLLADTCILSPRQAACGSGGRSFMPQARCHTRT